MELARRMVQGVDVWLNTPTRPLEALPRTARSPLHCILYEYSDRSKTQLDQTVSRLTEPELQTLLGSMLVQYPAETISGSHARHHDKQNGKNHEFPGSGTDAYLSLIHISLE